MEYILIDKEKLSLLLDGHKEDIWLKKAARYQIIADQAALGISVYIGNLPETWFNIALAYIILMIGWSIYKIMTTPQYSTEQLQKDIHSLNEIHYPYSIVAIKDTYNKYPNRFLLYYDRKWKCKFFPNYKNTGEDNVSRLIERLSTELHIPQSDITLEEKGRAIHQKPHPVENIKKWYDHTLYLADITNLPKEYQQPIFEIDGTTYYWLTLADMEADKVIQEKNMDVVSLVKNHLA